MGNAAGGQVLTKNQRDALQCQRERPYGKANAKSHSRYLNMNGGEKQPSYSTTVVTDTPLADLRCFSIAQMLWPIRDMGASRTRKAPAVLNPSTQTDPRPNNPAHTSKFFPPHLRSAHQTMEVLKQNLILHRTLLP